MFAEVFFLSIPLVIFCVALFGAHLLAKRRNNAGLAFGLVCLALFSLSMVERISAVSGLNEIIYWLALIGISAPAAAGGLIGSLFGWFQHDTKAVG